MAVGLVAVGVMAVDVVVAKTISEIAGNDESDDNTAGVVLR